MNLLSYLAGIFFPWILKTVLYHYVFRWRHIRATVQTKIIVAGAPILVRGIVPIPLPGILFFVVAVSVAVYLCKQYTDGKMFPDIVAVVTGIELCSSIFERVVL